MSKAKERKTARGNKFTRAWKSKDGKEVEKGDAVKAADGDLQGIVTMRFTHPKGRIPMLMVAGEPARSGGGKQGRQQSIPAKEVTVVKKGGDDK